MNEFDHLKIVRIVRRHSNYQVCRFISFFFSQDLDCLRYLLMIIRRYADYYSDYQK